MNAGIPVLAQSGVMVQGDVVSSSMIRIGCSAGML